MTKHKVIKTVIFAVVFVVALILIYIVLQTIDNRDTVNLDDYEEAYSQEEADIVIDGFIYELAHPVKTYLLMGTDASGNEEAKGDAYHGAMADFLLLMVVDKQEKKYGFIEINRDTVTNVPMMNQDGSVDIYSEMQICTAHWYGGSKRMSCENTVDAVSKFLYCVPIDGYYALPMEAIGSMNRAVGGVPITFDKDYTDIDASFTKGTNLVLSDEQAEAFVRSRMNVEDGENASRMARQRLFLDSLFQVVLSKSQSDKKFLAQVYKQFDDISTDDINMNVVTHLGQEIAEYEALGIMRIEGEKTEGYVLGDDEIHAEFYADDDSVRTAIMTLFPLENTGVESEYDEEY